MDNHVDDIRRVVLAFGGNAIIRKGQSADIHTQFANTRQVLSGVVDLVAAGATLVIVHGNGPQVGHELIRSQLAAREVPPLPLGVLVADTEGGMGYMIQQCLQNVLWRHRMKKPVATILTQVVCDRNDPRLKEPTKPVGRFFTREEAEYLMQSQGWTMREDAGRGWRLVVPSPRPVAIVEHEIIRLLLGVGVIVIAGGGGGIPIVIEEDGTYEGLDVVVDKDFTASLIGRSVGADTLIIATDIDRVALFYNTPQVRYLDRITLGEAQRYLAEGHFAAGSMGPKIEASIEFLQNGGKRVIITSPDHIREAVAGKAGTTIVRGD
ncbi:MAG: carbamate kinase [Acidobacteriota bacterium]